MKRYILRCSVVSILLTTSILAMPEAFAWSDGSYTKTRYPIVLVPGAFGFGFALGVYDYWFGLTRALQQGGATVYLAKISPLHTTELRGEQLVQQLEDVLAVTGAQKVNLIAHSHGGPTARYAAAVLGERIASVTTVASPHMGAPLADELARDINPHSLWGRLLIALAGSLANLIGALSDNHDPNAPLGALHALTTTAAAAFNAKFPDGLPTQPCGEGPASAHGQMFFSFSGIGRATNALDISDPFMMRFGDLFQRSANDGLVGACSSHFGTVLRDDYHLNHLDEVNQLLGLVSLDHSNPIAIYRLHVNRLKRLGL